MRWSPANPGSRWRRSVLALFAATLLLAGALEIHPAGEALHESVLEGGRLAEGYSPQAIHPHEAHHFEAGTVVLDPVCPACLLQLLNGGAHTPEAVGVLPAEAVSRLVAVEAIVKSRLVVVSGAARAPPLA